MGKNPIREMCKLLLISLWHGLGKIRFFKIQSIYRHHTASNKRETQAKKHKAYKIDSLKMTVGVGLAINRRKKIEFYQHHDTMK